ncbi:hypothetical protein [Treponema sp.]|uniref:hypothetical protein n=1 Tax=Treponema sp. TaxID=166 RepID=UPI003FD88E25
MIFILGVIITYLIMKHIVLPFVNEMAEDEDCKDDWVYSGNGIDMFGIDDQK